MITIREYSELDKASIEKLMSESRVQAFGPGAPAMAESNVRMDELTNMMRSSWGTFFIVEDNRMVTGYLCIHAHTDTPPVGKGPDAVLSEIYMKETYRNRGLGKLLVLRAEMYAKKKGARRVEILHLPENKRVFNFYSSIGYHQKAALLSKDLK